MRKDGFYKVKRFHEEWEIALWQGGIWWICGISNRYGNEYFQNIDEIPILATPVDNDKIISEAYKKGWDDRSHPSLNSDHSKDFNDLLKSYLYTIKHLHERDTI